MSPAILKADGPTSKPKNWLMGTEAFERKMPHHEGMKALWETKWKFPCTKSVYPFHDGQFSDFEPIFEHMIAENINDGTSSAYTSAFFPTAERLEREGDEATAAGDNAKASDLYLRAACVLRIARFPYVSGYPKVSDQTKWDAWEWQKKVYMKAGRQWEEPVQEVEVPFVHRKGKDRETIPVYVRVPKGSSDANPCPTIILITGLDGYRPDNTQRCEEFLKRGWGVVVVEIPGTADSPADSADPESCDRMWDSLFAWMEGDGRFNMKKVMAWGLSSGGYYAIRIAHTHKDKLVGSIPQGAGCHYFFDREWLDKADGHEYPFLLLSPLAMKHGEDDPEEYKKVAMKKFSLLENGIIQKPSCRMLLINGTLDGLMPIEDSMMLFEYGTPKEARFFTGALHMGYPMANASVYPWMESVMNSC